MKIGIVGSRRRNSDKDLEIVENTFLDLLEEFNLKDEEVIIVSGGCPQGADRFAEIIACKNKMEMEIFPAKWDDLESLGPEGEKPVIRTNSRGKYNMLAGFWRNGDIAKASDVIIACVAEDRTGGTEDTLKKAQKLGKKIILC